MTGACTSASRPPWPSMPARRARRSPTCWALEAIRKETPCLRSFLARLRMLKRGLLVFFIWPVATQHQVKGTHLDPTLTDLGLIVVLLAELPIAPQPGQAPLHLPALRQQYEALGAFRPLDGLHLVASPLPEQPALQGPVVVPPVAVDLLQPRVVGRGQLCQHLR